MAVVRALLQDAQPGDGGNRQGPRHRQRSPGQARARVRCGDTVALRQGQVPRTVVIRGLSGMRGPAPVAQALYEETAESLAERERLAEQRRLAPEPASSIASQHEGRPTKRDRRQIDQVRERGSWDSRWSASIDDLDRR